jgi:anti-sigma regulatory factor (Ser/Thr protein kinase)
VLTSEPSSVAGPVPLVFPAVAAAVPLARTAAVAAAARHGLEGEQLEAVRLAVSEAVTNAITHAYPGETGEVRVIVLPCDDEVVVLVEDDGRGPDLPSVVPGLGWGCRLMTHVCEAFALLPGEPSGTTAHLRFRRPAPAR